MKLISFHVRQETLSHLPRGLLVVLVERSIETLLLGNGIFRVDRDDDTDVDQH